LDELDPDGNCSLREAVRAANLKIPVDGCPAGGAFNVINLPVGTFLLRLAGLGEDEALRGDLDLHANITVNGAEMNSTIIDGNGNASGDRIFDIVGNYDVTLANLTVQNGNVQANEGIAGGIWNRGGNLTLDHVTVRNNIS
jgi:CSLREA domain-containing protein